jgi:hypothetical protein
MNDRTNNSSENGSAAQDQRKHDQPQWIKKYLDLADTALRQRQDDCESRPAA